MEAIRQKVKENPVVSLVLAAAAGAYGYQQYLQNQASSGGSGSSKSAGNKAATVVKSRSCGADYEAARAMVADLIREKNCAPILLRLAWHDAGTFDAATGTGGPRGCMRFSTGESTHGANAGLDIARGLLEPIKQKFPDMTYADFWSLAGVVAVEEMGGPACAWRAGRTDADEKGSVEDGRLPDAQQGCPHLRAVFGRMKFSDQEIVALSGAHTIGGMKAERSGHIGDWTARKYNFDNAYYQDLLNLKWEKFTNDKGNVQFKSERNTFMLPSDMALLDDSKMKVWVELYAKDEARFFQDFASAFTKLQELGVKGFHR